MLTLIVSGILAAGAFTLAGLAALDFHREGLERLRRADLERKRALVREHFANVRTVPEQRDR